MLWNLYLEDLVDQFEQSDTIPLKVAEAVVHILLYTDDIILLAYTPGELKKKIEILKAYFEAHSLRMNLRKTNYMIFSNGHARQKCQFFWGHQEIQRVEYIYLGVPIHENEF